MYVPWQFMANVYTRPSIFSFLMGGGPGYGGCVLEGVSIKSEGIGCLIDCLIFLLLQYRLYGIGKLLLCLQLHMLLSLLPGKILTRIFGRWRL